MITWCHQIQGIKLIQGHFDYAPAFWFSGLSKKNKSKFQVLQNNVVIYLINLTPRTHVGANEFKCVKMLYVYYRDDQLKLHFMFNINHRVAPSYLFVTRVRDQHWHTIKWMMIWCPGSYTFGFTAAKLWNALPPNIQRINTPDSFRRAGYLLVVSNYESYDANPFMYS